ncbi:conserved protein of unknown function [Modestobacter italicus]|uniref:FAD-dependent urate hydroxylase HpyO/Asp monooxygenase CreE-like FAD/NAD(P)-binding domain-containing protein n=1 Tax=Modestobacter italicus (strain DSM 44449 / CECT 9708 / BC 501) TaxID=2732864 RepID=I4EXK2_MODI5|nr:FAD/NAD(P)-binding protein [Modestobacter marinus]CCH88115.1 conserved protein of unknown function [Modestobacter marinus]
MAAPVHDASRMERTAGRPTADHDLVFVGAGASTAYVLMGLLAALEDRPPAAPLRIGVVEREPDAFSGIAYGGRAARASLLITSLRDFLPDDERALFVAWLASNKDRVFTEFVAEAGPLSVRWWARHRAELDLDEFESLYLPRHVFGTYLMERTWRAIARAEAAGLARTDVVQDEVGSIERAAGGYLLHTGSGDVRTGQVVLATGSPPVLPRLPPRHEHPAVALVDDPFGGMAAAVELIRPAVQRPRLSGRPPHVVLIGGNAGTMDVLYHLNDLDVPALQQAVFTVLSPRGELPERMEDEHEPLPFSPEHLLALDHGDPVEAVGVFRAALADIARGRDLGLSVADTLRPISRAVGQLLGRLPRQEALEFAGRWGGELGRHQRRAGREYSEVVERLGTDGRLHQVPGRFLDVRDASPDGVHVRFEQDGRLLDLDLPADVVVNCAGPARELRQAGSTLLSQLLTSGICRATPFGGGIAVDACLEAAPGLFVMGPLLAGNLVNGAPLWHMEHCGRISSYGSALGADLARRLAAA